MSSKYSKLLESSAWKRKRDKIVSRDGCCQICGSKDNLNVHHVLYAGNIHPAEYADWLLITLCNKCHKKEHYFQNRIDSALKYMRMRGMASDEIYNKFLKNVECDEFEQLHEMLMEYKHTK